MHIEMKRLGSTYEMEAVNPQGNKVLMDNPNSGQPQAGASPMELLLMGLAGCSSIDIIAILQKQKCTVADLHVSVDAERDRSQTPAWFTSIAVEYRIDGEVPPKKAREAVELSLNRYCTVAAILEKSVKIEHRIVLNGTAL